MAIKTNLGDPNPIFAGEDRDLVFTVFGETGEVEDITGWSVSFTSGGVSKTVGAGIALTSPTSGVLTVSLSSTDTTSLTGGTDWKLRRTDSGLNTVLGYGRFAVQA